jgi:hypothetical protein
MELRGVVRDERQLACFGLSLTPAAPTHFSVPYQPRGEHPLAGRLGYLGRASSFHLTFQCTRWYSSGVPNKDGSILVPTSGRRTRSDGPSDARLARAAARLRRWRRPEQVSSGALQLRIGTLPAALMPGIIHTVLHGEA